MGRRVSWRGSLPPRLRQAVVEYKHVPSLETLSGEQRRRQPRINRYGRRPGSIGSAPTANSELSFWSGDGAKELLQYTN